MGLLVGVVRPEVCVWFLGMLFLELSGLGILVAEDEVQLIVFTALVWSKHDGVGGLVDKLVLEHSRGLRYPQW